MARATTVSTTVRCGGVADALGAAADAEAEVAGQAADDRAEDERLEQAGEEVADDDGLDRAAEVQLGREVLHVDGHDQPAGDADEVGDDGQARRHQGRRDDARHDEEARRVDRVRLHRLNLLADDHRAEFGGDAGPGKAESARSRPRAGRARGTWQ